MLTALQRANKNFTLFAEWVGLGGPSILTQRCYMADDKTNRGPAGRARINVHEPHQVAYWTKELDVTPEKLEDLVLDHGTSAEAIRSAIAGKRGSA